jgi:2-dehydropantoate 2-reductase
MRFLVVGAGATGGYSGGRLLEAGRDVTFLVRPARAGRLAAAGLTIAGPAGGVALRSPPAVLAAELRAPSGAAVGQVPVAGPQRVRDRGRRWWAGPAG